MVKMRKLISLLLCFAMLTSMCVFAEETAVAETVTNVESIEIDWNSIGLLESLGIIEPVDRSTAQEFLSEQFSRAEFAVALVKFNNMEDVVGSGEGFNDVVPNSKEEAYINTAVNMGLIASVTDKYFYPQYPISYQDAAQAFVMSLGYSAVAEINDSWLIQAKKLGLMKGVDTGAAFTRAQAYRMIFNALHADVMEVTGIEGGISDYATREGYDALNKFFNIKHDEGLVTLAGGIEFTVPAVSPITDQIKVNGKRYKYVPHLADEFLGRNAVVYYNNNSEAVYVLLKNNEELVIPSSEILNYNNLTYTYGDNKETAKIANPFIILNGAEYLGSPSDVSVMHPAAGSVTLIDNNRDGIYDVVFIQNYIDYVVKNLITNSNNVVDVYGSVVSLDPNAKLVRIFNADGEEIAFEDLKANDVLSIANSTSVMSVYVSQKTIQGLVSKTATVNGRTVWYINDEAYNLSSALENAMATNNPELETFKMSTYYTFYLNAYGEIAYYNQDAADDKFYAYLSVGKKEGIDGEEVTLKLFSKQYGGMESFKLPKKVMLNGSVASPERVYECLCRNGVDGGFDSKIVPQPLKVKVNENNEITYIAQAGVANYYNEVDLGGDPYYADASTVAPYTTEPEFELYMGHFDTRTVNGSSPYRMPTHVFGKDILEFGIHKNATFNFDKTKYTYNSKNSNNHLFKNIGVIPNSIQCMEVPFNLNKEDPGYGFPVPAKEDYFHNVGFNTNGYYQGQVYREGDSLQASLMIIAGNVAAAKVCSSETNYQVVKEISRAYVDEQPMTALVTSSKTHYIPDGVCDLNNLPLYALNKTPITEFTDAPRSTLYPADPTGIKYQVKPGDIVLVATDAAGYVTCVEAVYDYQNECMLGQGSGNFGANTSAIHVPRTSEYGLVKTDLLRVEGNVLECVMVNAETYNPTNLAHQKYITKKLGATLVEETRNGWESRTPAATDYIAYEDSPTDFVQVFVKARYNETKGMIIYK